MDYELENDNSISVSIEQSLLGTLFYSNNKIEIVRGMIQPRDFFSKANETVYQAMLDSWETEGVIDPILLIKRLQDTGKLEGIGGEQYVASLVSGVFSSESAIEYAKKIKTIYTNRTLSRYCEMAQRFKDSSEEDVLTQLLDKLHKLSLYSMQCQVKPKSSSEVITALDLAFREKKPSTRIRTGFWNLDSILTGFYPGQFVLIAARPSMGKTSFAMNMINTISETSKVLLFSLEMPEEQIISNWISSVSQVPTNLVHERRLSDANLAAIGRSILDIKKRSENFWIIDHPLNIQQIESEIKYWTTAQNITDGNGIVFIDYIQLIDCGRENNKKSIYENVTEISKRIKRVAKTANIPVVCMCQLNREIEKRIDVKPRMSDLRESGSLEQDADTILFIVPEEHDEPATMDRGRPVKIVVEKNRVGPKGEAKMLFHPYRVSFVAESC